jgi:hypothetical protein
VRIESSATSLRIFAPPPGLRRAVIAQLAGVGVAASIALYWLRMHPYWVLGCGLFYVYQGAKVFRLSYQPTTIVVQGGILRVTTRGWMRDRTVEFELSPDLELSVEAHGERMQIELFPMHGLQLRHGERRAAVLRGHDVATLNTVQSEIVAWRQRQV